jgi:hypothetical protein
MLGERPVQAQLDNAMVLKSSWSDPDDTTPGAAKAARQITGWRRYCPLRRCLQRHGERSNFSMTHIVAADKLRAAFDGARIGFSGLRSWTPVNAVQYRPSQGPTRSAMAQLKARMQFDRAWATFDDRQRALLASVVLLNTAITVTAELLGISPNLATQQLVAALDVLVDRLGVQRDIDAGRVAA